MLLEAKFITADTDADADPVHEVRFPPIVSSEIEEGVEYHVSWSQSQMLTIHVVDSTSAAYNIPHSLWLRGEVSVDALRFAVRCIFLVSPWSSMAHAMKWPLITRLLQRR